MSARQRSRRRNDTFRPGYGVGENAIAQADIDIDAAVQKALAPMMSQLSSRTTAQPVNLIDALNQLTRQNGFAAAPMARDPRNRVPFGPLDPLNPAGLDPARPDTGRPEPRLNEYPVATNINTNRPLPWATLRQAADNVDILRRCIEVRKADMRSLDWAWVVSDEAVAEAYRANPARGKSDLAAELREQWGPEIKRLTEFWTNPWPAEGLDFGAWVNMVMEDRLVLDAVTVYPQTTWGGDLLAFEIIDSSSIKVLRDYRGARPTAPFPAFQQILYGFPRGEWQATTETDDQGQEVLKNGFLADQMHYVRENARSTGPYGFSPVEQALIAARLYLKRQGWMLSEYDDGVLPEMIIESSETLSLTPIERRAYETALNDELTGQTAARHRAKVMFPGTKTTLLPSVAERYKPDYDLFLIKLLASHLGVSATKLGFSETKGLGGAGMHEAQAQAAQDLGVVPDIKMLTSLVMTLSKKWLRTPVELTFKFLDADGENEQVRAAIVAGEMGTAQTTVNEARVGSGKPVLDIPEADMPYILTATGPVFLEGSSAPKVAPGQPTAAAANAGADQAQADPATAQTVNPGAAETGGKPGKSKKTISKHAGPDDVSAQAVIDQLSPDYPPDAMSWIHGAHWSGPTSIPLSKIDFDDVDSWDASGDPAKVDAFTKKIRAGKMKPTVVVRVPGDDRYKVVDGHHRVLAYQKLGKPVHAWVGRVGAKVGPWTTMHSKQHVGGETGTGSDAPTSGAPSGAEKSATIEWRAVDILPAVILPPAPVVSVEKLAEIRQYRRFVAKGVRGRDFAWVHHSPGEIAEITKAAGDDTDPKAEAAATPPPVQPDNRWPAWAVDTLLATFWAAAIRKALTSGLDTRAIAEAWARDTASWQASDAVPDALSWLRAYGVDTAEIVAILGPVLRDATVVGYSVGAQSAKAALEQDLRTAVELTTDWSDFKPGSVSAARQVLSADGMIVHLEDLLDRYGVTISGIAEGRRDELADVLADGLERGESPQTIATALRGIVDDPDWTMTVAWTETNRAQSSAALDRYRIAGKTGKEWFTAHDQRVCPSCLGNQNEGVIPLDQSFSSGDQAPPAHPRCRCAPLPATLATVKSFNPDEMRGEHGEWSAVGAIEHAVVDAVEGKPGKPKPAKGTPSDKLKLAGRIHLDSGETLVGSSKVDGESGTVRLAATDKRGARSLHFGAGDSAFGSRDSEAGIWSGGPDKFTATNAERAKIRAEQENLERSYDSLQPGPARDAVEARLGELDDIDTSDVYADGHTARFDAAAVGRIQASLAEIHARAVNTDAKHSAGWEKIDALEAERKSLRYMDRSMTPEEETKLRSIEAQIAEIKTSLGEGNGSDEPKIHGKGIVSGEWGDLHYHSELDDIGIGSQTRLTVVPHGSTVDDVEDTSAYANLDNSELATLLKQLGLLMQPPDGTATG
jgi:SPP1 gp7 family putative phage head morphogenesis protein